MVTTTCSFASRVRATVDRFLRTTDTGERGVDRRPDDPVEPVLTRRHHIVLAIRGNLHVAVAVPPSNMSSEVTAQTLARNVLSRLN